MSDQNQNIEPNAGNLATDQTTTTRAGTQLKDDGDAQSTSPEQTHRKLSNQNLDFTNQDLNQSNRSLKELLAILKSNKEYSDEMREKDVRRYIAKRIHEIDFDFSEMYAKELPDKLRRDSDGDIYWKFVPCFSGLNDDSLDIRRWSDETLRVFKKCMIKEYVVSAIGCDADENWKSLAHAFEHLGRAGRAFVVVQPEKEEIEKILNTMELEAVVKEAILTLVS